MSSERRNGAGSHPIELLPDKLHFEDGNRRRIFESALPDILEICSSGFPLRRRRGSIFETLVKHDINLLLDYGAAYLSLGETIIQDMQERRLRVPDVILFSHGRVVALVEAKMSVGANPAPDDQANGRGRRKGKKKEPRIITQGRSFVRHLTAHINEVVNPQIKRGELVVPAGIDRLEVAADNVPIVLAVPRDLEVANIPPYFERIYHSPFTRAEVELIARDRIKS